MRPAPPHCKRRQDDGSWQCKHGDDECAGDLQQLCVQQFSSEYNRVNLLLNFILCSNRAGEVVGSFATATKCLKVCVCVCGCKGLGGCCSRRDEARVVTPSPRHHAP
jgi:hypothetical protein